jgi:hypothetical protein
LAKPGRKRQKHQKEETFGPNFGPFFDFWLFPSPSPADRSETSPTSLDLEGTQSAESTRAGSPGPDQTSASASQARPWGRSNIEDGEPINFLFLSSWLSHDIFPGVLGVSLSRSERAAEGRGAKKPAARPESTAGQAD